MEITTIAQYCVVTQNFNSKTWTTNYKAVYFYHTSKCLIIFDKYLNVWYMAQKMSLIPFGFWHYYFHRGTSIYYLVSPDFGASSSIQSTNFLDQPALTSWISQHFKCNRTRHKIIELIISTRETTTKVKRKMLRHVHFLSIYKSCQASDYAPNCETDPVKLFLFSTSTWRSEHWPVSFWKCPTWANLSACLCRYVHTLSNLNIDQCPSGSLTESRLIHSTKMKFLAKSCKLVQYMSRH
jgi:hypothetical protein